MLEEFRQFSHRGPVGRMLASSALNGLRGCRALLLDHFVERGQLRHRKRPVSTAFACWERLAACGSRIASVVSCSRALLADGSDDVGAAIYVE